MSLIQIEYEFGKRQIEKLKKNIILSYEISRQLSLLNLLQQTFFLHNFLFFLFFIE